MNILIKDNSRYINLSILSRKKKRCDFTSLSSARSIYPLAGDKEGRCSPGQKARLGDSTEGRKRAGTQSSSKRSTSITDYPRKCRGPETPFSPSDSRTWGWFLLLPNEHNFLFSLMLSYSLGSIKMPLSDPALDTLKSLGKVKADKNSSLCCSFLPVRPTSNPDPPGPFQAGSRNTAGSESPSTACVFLHSQPGAATSSHLFAEKRQKPEDGTSSISWRACTCTKS